VPVAPGRVPLLGHRACRCGRRPTDFVRSLGPVGDVVRLELGAWPVYFLTTSRAGAPGAVAQARSFARGLMFERARPLLGTGLATSDGDLHRRQGGG